MYSESTLGILHYVVGRTGTMSLCMPHTFRLLLAVFWDEKGFFFEVMRNIWIKTLNFVFVKKDCRLIYLPILNGFSK